jgi:hypothetical protein
MRRMLSSVLMFGVIAACGYGQTAASTTSVSVQLVVDWNTSVQPYQSREAICVDSEQNVQVITRDGLWTTLNQTGSVIRSSLEPALRGTVSIWCSQPGQVVMGVPSSNATTVYRYSDAHEPISQESIPGRFRRVFTDDSGGLVLAPSGGTSLLVKPLADGIGDSSPQVLTPIPDSILALRRGYPDRYVNTFVSPNMRDGNIICVSSNPEVVTVFSKSGQLLSTVPVPEILRLSSQSSLGPPTPQSYDQVYGIFPLGKHLYITNLDRTTYSNDHTTVNTYIEYQILDDTFKIVGHTSTPGIGLIEAADSDGNVYGVSAAGQQLHIIRAHPVQ